MDFIEALKKIDLHCHLDGSLSEQTIVTMAQRVGLELPSDKAALSRRLRVGDDCKSLAECLTYFDIPIACLVTEENLEAAAIDVMRQAAAEQVIYIELRFAPLLSVHEKLSCRQVIESVVRGIRKGHEQYGIMGNAILCGMRHETTANNIEMLTVGREFLGQGVCAVDLAGDEAAHPVLEHKAFFEAAQKLGIPYTIHAGECLSAQSVRDAIALGAKRIGHGIAMKNDPETRAFCKAHGVGIELCPTSNLQTRAIASMDIYPLRSYLEEGLLATVNTDNRTVSNTTSTQELRILQEKVGLTEDEMRLVMRNAAQVAFVDEETRKILLKKLA